MCFHCNITNVVCVRYIHIGTEKPNGYSSYIRYLWLFIVLNKSEQRNCT